MPTLSCSLVPSLTNIYGVCYVQHRQYIYIERERRFTQLPSLSFHNKCILCVSHFLSRTDWLPTAQQAFLCSTATDGKVAIWNLDKIVCQWMVQHLSSTTCDLQGGLDEVTANIEPSCVFEAHQSGINAISHHAVGGSWCAIIFMQYEKLRLIIILQSILYSCDVCPYIIMTL